MKIDYRRPDLSIDQQLALRTAATNLARQFDATFGKETIERFLHSSYDEFAGRAVVLNYLPLLAERFARQRLLALAVGLFRSVAMAVCLLRQNPTQESSARCSVSQSTVSRRWDLLRPVIATVLELPLVPTRPLSGYTVGDTTIGDTTVGGST